MRKYVIAKYIRLSLEDEKYDSLSIPNQHTLLNRYIADMDIPDAEVLEFVDNGHSGTSFERPAVQELLEMVRAKKIDCIAVKDFSRFGRNAIETGYFIEMVFPLFGVRFISVGDGFDSAEHEGDTGGLDVSFKFLMNEYYSKDLSIKSKSAKYIKFKSGEYQSSICPYGYRKGYNGRMEIDEETAPIVRFIFESALLTQNAQEIVKLLYDKQIPTPGEYRKAQGKAYYDTSRSIGIWQRTTVNRILSDERYTGTYIMGKRAVIEVGSSRTRPKDESEWIKIPDHYPAIIDREHYAQVQAKLKHFKCPKRPREYALRGKVYCGCCLHAMVRAPRKEPAFVCRYTKVDELAVCHGLEISEAELEAMLFTAIQKQAHGILESADANDLLSIDADVSQYSAQIAEHTDAKQLLYEQLVLGEIAAKTYTAEKAVLDKRILQFQQAASASSIRIEQYQKIKQTSENLLNLAKKASEADTLTYPLVDLLIDKVHVLPGKILEIIWRPAFTIT